MRFFTFFIMPKLPVLLLAFNRPDDIDVALVPIRQYQPERLYLACDGPRPDKPEDAEMVKETQRRMTEGVDWPCEVFTLFRESNLGCEKAVSGAVTWFFEHEEYGVIVEDDVVLSPDFFTLCEELLPYYKDEPRVQQICASYYGKHNASTSTYGFQRRPQIWGWASWRRAWQDYMDVDMKAWPHFRIFSLVPTYGLFWSLMMWRYWHRAYHRSTSQSSWATRWHFAAAVNNLLSITPLTNLSLNVGTTGGGTNYRHKSSDPFSHMQMGHITLPLRHPAKVSLTWSLQRIDRHLFWSQRWLAVKNFAKRILHIK